MKTLRIVCVFTGFLSLVLSLSAQTFTTLYAFSEWDGFQPAAPLVQATNGDFYGTTSGGSSPTGGPEAPGTVFGITPSGTLTALYTFCSQPNCSDGAAPQAGLIQAANWDPYPGDLYGTTWGIPYYSPSTIFEMTPTTGTLKTIYSFGGVAGPWALVQAKNGDFYGTTVWGGANGDGTVFKITAKGNLTTLYSFCSQQGCTDGFWPLAGLVEAYEGFYGTTAYGAANSSYCSDNGCGTVFRITGSGKLTTLYSFCSQGGICADGANPVKALVEGKDGDLYGETFSGGANGYGTVFKMTAEGNLTTLYSFCSQSGCVDGAGPEGVIQATDGNFYGTTSQGGANGQGTIFELTPHGVLKTLYSFCSQGGSNCTDGASPAAALIQGTDGSFYGTTYSGGNDVCEFDLFGKQWFEPCGTVFKLSVGLGPFVETLPTSGKVGAEVGILGTDLTGATSVTFNGTPAQFKVKSPTLILTHVPTGATTGTVQVTTPKGTLKSNVAFRVTQ